MKKLLSLTGLILIMLALSTVSCDKEKTTEEQMAGKWNAVSEKDTGYINDVKDYEETYTYDEGEMYIELSEDGTGKVYIDGDLEDTFTWSIDGNKITITNTGEDPMEGTFTLDGDSLTVIMTHEEDYEGDTYKDVSEMHFTRG